MSRTIRALPTRRNSQSTKMYNWFVREPMHVMESTEESDPDLYEYKMSVIRWMHRNGSCRRQRMHAAAAAKKKENRTIRSRGKILTRHLLEDMVDNNE